MKLYDESGLVGEDDSRIVHQARRNGDHYLQIIADTPGEYAYSLRTSGVSGIDLSIEELGVSRNLLVPETDFRISGSVRNLRGDVASSIPVDFFVIGEGQAQNEGILLDSVVLTNIQGATREPFAARVTMPTSTQLQEIGVAIPGNAELLAIIDPLRMVPDLDRTNNERRLSLTLGSECIDDDQNINEGPSTSTALVWADAEKTATISW